MNLKRLARGPAIWIVLAVLILWLGASSFMTTGIQRIDTSDGLALLAGDTVEQARIVDGQQRVDLVLTEPFEDKGERVQFYYVEPQGPTVVAALEGADLPGGYDSEVPQTSWWVSILSLVIPFVIILGLFWFFMSRMQGGGSRVMNFGKSKAKRMSVDAPKITFRDVAGAERLVTSECDPPAGSDRLVTLASSTGGFVTGRTSSCRRRRPATTAASCCSSPRPTPNIMPPYSEFSRMSSVIGAVPVSSTRISVRIV